MQECRIQASMDCLVEGMDFLRSGAEACGLGAAAASQVELAAEEALVNVIHYAYPEAPGELWLRWEVSPKGLEIEIRDQGIPFDPLAQAEPALDLPMEARPIGGLGIHLIKKVMDHVSYRREEGCNILRLVKGKRPRGTGEVEEW